MRTSQRAKLSTVCVIVTIVLVQLPFRGQVLPQQKRTASSAGQIVKLKRSPASLVMAKAFSEGKLPEPARLPRGNVDQQAAALAKAVALRDESSTGALYAAVLAAGYGVRDTDGSIIQTNTRGQGLIINAWELAATAKLYGEEYGVMLSHLSEAFVRGVPALKDVPLANVLLDGIRAGANGTQPSARFLSRFIVELGRSSEPANDLLGNVDPAKTRLDAIQVALLMSRLAGELLVLEQKTARVNYSHAKTANWQSPCPTNDTQDVILDYNQVASSTLFGILTERLGGKSEKYGRMADIANVVATVFKFILSYALLDVEISMNGNILERTKSNTTPGELKTLTAKLKIDPTPWERVNCLRPFFNAAGLEIELAKSGPLADTTVQWSLVLGGDSRGALGTLIDLVTGDDDRDNLVYLKPKASTNPMPNGQIADSNGVSNIDVVGAPQKEDLTRRKVFEVYKAAGVTVGVQVKPMKIKDAQAALSTVGDIVDTVISFLTKDYVGGGTDVVFETMYRSNWYSAKPFYFIVKDWEPCKGQWIGTITYTTTLKDVGSAEDFRTRRTWNDEASYEGTAQLDGRTDNHGAPMVRVTAKAHERSERFSTGKVGCFYAGTKIRELNGSETVDTSGFYVLMNPRSGQYNVSFPAILVSASGFDSNDAVVKGNCNNPYNKDVHEKSALSMQLSGEGPGMEASRRIDPNNRDVLSGTETVTVTTTKGVRTSTITWNLRRCQDQ